MQSTFTDLPPPAQLQSSLSQQEHRLRSFYQRMVAPTQLPNRTTPNPAGRRRFLTVSPKILLQISAQLLELVSVLAVFAEVIRTLPEKTTQPAASAKQVEVAIESRTGLSLPKVLSENQAIISAAKPNTKQDLAMLSPDIFIPIVSSLLTAVPIRELEMMAERIKEPSLGYRCRRAYECLQEFINRHDPTLDQKLKVLGAAYAEGRLSLQEISAVVSLPPWDLIPQLERLGFSRKLPLQQLSEQEQNSILDKLLEERMTRNGEPTLNKNLVSREVIASQRIEGVDARQWLTPKA